MQHRVRGERTSLAYRYLYEGARRSLKYSREQVAGQIYSRMSAGVFAAFTAEAYFNHIGPHVVTFWPQLERLSPKDKAEVLSKALFGTAVDWSRRPFQTLNRVFQFRDKLAHGRTEILRIDQLVEEDEEHDEPTTSWEKSCTDADIDRFVTDVGAVVEHFHGKYQPGRAAFGIVALTSYDRSLSAEQLEKKKSKPKSSR